MARKPKKPIEGMISRTVEEDSKAIEKVNQKKVTADSDKPQPPQQRLDKPVIIPDAPQKGPKQVTSTELTPEEQRLVEDTLKLPKEKAPGETQSPFDKKMAELPSHVRREIMKETPDRNRAKGRGRKAAQRNTPEDKKRTGHTAGEKRKGAVKRLTAREKADARRKELLGLAKAKAEKFPTEAEIEDAKYAKQKAYDEMVLADPDNDPDINTKIQGLPEFLRTYSNTPGTPGIIYSPNDPKADKHGYVSQRHGGTPDEYDLIAHLIYLEGVPGIDDADNEVLDTDTGHPVRKEELSQETGDYVDGRPETVSTGINITDTSVSKSALQAAAKATKGSESEMVKQTRERQAQQQFAENQDVAGLDSGSGDLNFEEDTAGPSRLEFDENNNASVKSRAGLSPQATTRQEREKARLGYVTKLLANALNARGRFREEEESSNAFPHLDPEPQRNAYPNTKEGSDAYTEDLTRYNLRAGKVFQLQEGISREQADARINSQAPGTTESRIPNLLKHAQTHLNYELLTLPDTPFKKSLVDAVKTHGITGETLLSPENFKQKFGEEGLKLEGVEDSFNHEQFRDLLGYDPETLSTAVKGTRKYDEKGNILNPGLSKEVVVDQLLKFPGTRVKENPETKEKHLRRGPSGAPTATDVLYGHVFDAIDRTIRQPSWVRSPSAKKEGDRSQKDTGGRGLTRAQLVAVNELRKSGKLDVTSNTLFSEGVQDPTLDPQNFRVNPVTGVETARGSGGRFTKPAAERLKAKAIAAGSYARRVPAYETKSVPDIDPETGEHLTETVVIENPNFDPSKPTEPHTTINGKLVPNPGYDPNNQKYITTQRPKMKSHQSPVMESYQETDEEGNLQFERRQKVDESGNPAYDENAKPIMERVPVMGTRQKMIPTGVDNTGKRTGVFRRGQATVEVGKDKKTGEPLLEHVITNTEVTGYAAPAALAMQKAINAGTVSPELLKSLGISKVSKNVQGLAKSAELIEQQQQSDAEMLSALGKSVDAYNERRHYIALAKTDLQDARRVRASAEEQTRNAIARGTHTTTVTNADGTESEKPGLSPLGDEPRRSEFTPNKAGEEAYQSARRSHQAHRGQITRAIKDAGRKAVVRHIERIRNQSELETDPQTGEFVYEEVPLDNGDIVRRPKLRETPSDRQGQSREDVEIRATVLENLLGTPPSARTRVVNRKVYGGKYYTGANPTVSGRSAYPAGYFWKSVLDITPDMEVEDIGPVSYTENPSEREKKDWAATKDYTGNHKLNPEYAINEALSSIPKRDETGQVIYKDESKTAIEPRFTEAPANMDTLLDDLGITETSDRVRQLSSDKDLTIEEASLARALRQRGYKATATGVSPITVSQAQRLQDAKEGKVDLVAAGLNARLSEADKRYKETTANIEASIKKDLEAPPLQTAPAGVSGYGMLPFLPQRREKVTRNGVTTYGRSTGVPVTGTQFKDVAPLRVVSPGKGLDPITENEDSPIIDPLNLGYSFHTPYGSTTTRASTEGGARHFVRTGQEQPIKILADDKGTIHYTTALSSTEPSTEHGSDDDGIDIPSVKSGDIRGSGEHKMTAEDYANIYKEHHTKTTSGRQKIADALSTAAAHGDLRENSEYDSALQEQGRHEREVDKLQHKLQNFSIIDPKTEPGASIGKHVTLNLNGKDQTFEMVGTGESKSEHPGLSINSPIGKAISGKESGHVFNVNTPSGPLSGSITDISMAKPSEDSSIKESLENSAIISPPNHFNQVLWQKDGLTGVTHPLNFPPPNQRQKDGLSVRGTGNYVRFGRLSRGAPQPVPKTTTQLETKPATPDIAPDITPDRAIRKSIGELVDSNTNIFGLHLFGKQIVDHLNSNPTGRSMEVTPPSRGVMREQSGSGFGFVNPGPESGSGSPVSSTRLLRGDEGYSATTLAATRENPDVPGSTTLEIDTPGSLAHKVTGRSPLPAGSRFINPPAPGLPINPRFGSRRMPKPDSQEPDSSNPVLNQQQLG